MTALEALTEFLVATAPAFATLIAAFMGAKYAFRLHDEKEKRAADASKIEYANLALFYLIRAYNHFLVIRRQFIDEHTDIETRHFQIMPSIGDAWEPLHFDFHKLSFLFDSSDPNITGRMSVFSQMATSTHSVIEERSRFHMNVVQPKAEEVAGGADTAALGELERALGRRQTAHLRSLTEEMVKGIDDIIAECPDLINDLRKVVAGIYPKARLLKLETPKK